MYSMESLVRQCANRVENRQCLTGAADELHGATLIDPTTDALSGQETCTDFEETVLKRESCEIRIDVAASRICVPQLLMLVGMISIISAFMAISIIALEYLE
ncbi:hypothetical protein Y032_0113g343 [Ancylostoma ceylanicum]|uniref:Uncharacterized protein n=3 Tax=Ancylostoma ceylanicum TaxID=53326 RepID=A0A016TDB1_9BILA|nr:hypothetical protein Y032_0113g343 [Ancylostoma ceylanicum]